MVLLILGWFISVHKDIFVEGLCSYVQGSGREQIVIGLITIAFPSWQMKEDVSLRSVAAKNIIITKAYLRYIKWFVSWFEQKSEFTTFQLLSHLVLQAVIWT